MKPETKLEYSLLAEIQHLTTLLDEHEIAYQLPQWLSPLIKNAKSISKLSDKPDQTPEQKIKTDERRSAPVHTVPAKTEPLSTEADAALPIIVHKTYAGHPKRSTEWVRSETLHQQAGNIESVTKAARILMDHFKGYSDRYLLRSKEDRYFQPCKNRFNPELCPKARHESRATCSRCEHLQADPLSIGHYVDHLRGIGGLKILPVFDEDRVLFASIDLDHGQAWKTIQDLARSAETYGLDYVLEQVAQPETQTDRFRLWFFFAIPTTLSRAANFLSSFLLNSFALGDLDDPDAFDAAYPSQPASALTSRMVEVPLRGLLHTQGSGEISRLISRDGSAIDDPFEALASIRKIHPDQISDQIRECRDHSRQNLFATIQDGQAERHDYQDSATLFGNNDDPLSFEPLSDASPLTVVEKGRISLDASTLPDPVKSQIIALASYWNPAFQKKNARFASGPRVISLAQKEEDESGNTEISLPRHLRNDLIQHLEAAGAEVIIDDQMSDGQSVPMQFNGELRPEQVRLGASLISQGSGILEAATGTGKTVIGAWLTAKLSRSTLILVNSKEILQGWVKALNQFLIFEDPEAQNWKAPSKNYPGRIGVLQASTSTLTGRVDVAMVPSLASKKNLEELVSGYGVVLVDECHHAGSPTYQKILDALKARSVFGFSATPQRTDGKSLSMHWQLGEIAASFTSKEQMSSQSFFRLVAPRFTPFVPADPDSTDFMRLAQEAASHPARNEMIIRDVKEALDNSRTVLVLTRFVEHARLLARLLDPDEKTDVFVYAGDPSQKAENTRILKTLSDRRRREQRKTVLIGTYASVGEGFDFPELDTLMLALPVRSQITVSQAIGRIHRQTEGKQVAIVYDYADVECDMLEHMYQARLKEYRRQGYQIGSPIMRSNDLSASSQTLFDDRSWIEQCLQDLSSTKEKVALCARVLGQEQAEQLLPHLSALAARHVRVDLFLEKADEALRQTLLQNGIHLHIHPRITAHFLILDQEIIWYGNVFSPASLQGGLLRMVSRREADELLEPRRKQEVQLIRQRRMLADPDQRQTN